MRRIHLIAALSVLVLGASPALADRGGHGHSTALPGASCSVSGDVVTAVGLPTDQVINFLITDDAGTWGWVLGLSDATWSVQVPAPNGSTTYQFVSRTWGPNGSKYDVFANC